MPLNTRADAREHRTQLELAEPRLVVEERPAGDEAEVELRRSVDPDAVHTVLFTSGTTGSPRRVELTDRNHHASATASAERLGVDTDNLAVLLRSAIYVTMAVVHESFNPARVHAVLEGGRRDGS